MTVTYAELQKARPDLFGEAAVQWALLAKGYGDEITAYRKTVFDPVHNGSWGGVGAMAAKQEMLLTLQKLTATQDYLKAVAVLLADAAIGFGEAQKLLNYASSYAQSHQLVIDANGTVNHAATPPLVGTKRMDPPGVIDPDVTTARNFILEALDLAERVDTRVSAGLRNAQKFGPNDNGPWLQDAQHDLDAAEHVLPSIEQAVDLRWGDNYQDHALRPWKVESAGPQDGWYAFVMSDALVWLRGKGYHTAADLLKHWLDNSGQPVSVDPKTMLAQIPGFQAAVNTQLAQHHGNGTFDSGWQNFNGLNKAANRNTPQALNWYYAFNDFRYRVLGTTETVHGRKVTHYTVEVYKNYQYNPGHTPIPVPHTPWKLHQSALAHLNSVGLAHDFVVTGSAEFTH